MRLEFMVTEFHIEMCCLKKASKQYQEFSDTLNSSSPAYNILHKDSICWNKIFLFQQSKIFQQSNKDKIFLFQQKTST